MSRRARKSLFVAESLEIRRLLATLTVNTNADNTSFDPVLTLREAIMIVNQDLTVGSLSAGELAQIDQTDPLGTNDTINFNIGGGGQQTISPLSALPDIDAEVFINGYSQPGSIPNSLAVGSNAVINIEIEGSSAGANASGLTLEDESIGSVIRGLAINRFDDAGILALFTEEITIAGNFIGTDTGGVLDLGNGRGVALAFTSDSIIGGTAPADRNLISGNDDDGVQTFDGSSNSMQGNYIGTDADGTVAIPNGSYGVTIRENGNTVGGTAPGAGNLISGNTLSGILVSEDDGIPASFTLIQGNFIGTNATGDAALPNLEHGIAVESGAFLTTIRQNLISGNGGAGISFSTVGSATVQANTIGLNAAGNAAIPNNGSGISVRRGGGLLIGGILPGAGNVITGNDGDGINLDDTGGELVQGNRIGLFATGTAGPGNGGAGVFIGERCNNVTIGGSIAAAGNVIAFNQQDGVTVSDTGTVGTSRNPIRLNSIYANGKLGIDLSTDGDNGPTPNDYNDLDEGANHLQNFPILTNALLADGNISIQGTFNSTPNRTYIIDFYSNDLTDLDPSGFGEGRYYVGSIGVITDPFGNASYSASFPTTITTNRFITSTATRTDTAPASDTSEFSQPIEAFLPAPPPPPPAAPPAPSVSINDVSQNEGNAGTTAFTFTLTRTGDLTNSSIVSVSTADGSAIAPGDYATQTSILVAFAPGSPTATFTVNVNGDPNVEPDQNFFVNVTSVTNATIGDGQGQGTIVNDDPPPTITINDVTQNEGNGGATSFTFTLTRSGDLSLPSTVSWSTADGSASAPTDYGTVAATQVVFIAGQATAQVTVTVNGDTTVETDETFFVNLTSVSNATISDSQGVGTIKNDDANKPKCEYVQDPCDPSKTALKVTGTDAGEAIDVWYGGAQGKVTVKINNVSLGTFTFTGSIIVCGEAGNDTIRVEPKITRNCYLFGGDGNDTFVGAGGCNVIICGRGNDKATGGSNRDIIVGGEGSDSCDGGSGDDLLIAGCSTYDNSLADLCKVQKEWCRADKDYKTRCNNVRAGTGYCGGIKFCETTIPDDNALDTCKGGSGNDMFWTNQTGGTQKDKLSDKSSSETNCELV